MPPDRPGPLGRIGWRHLAGPNLVAPRSALILDAVPGESGEWLLAAIPAARLPAIWSALRALPALGARLPAQPVRATRIAASPTPVLELLVELACRLIAPWEVAQPDGHVDRATPQQLMLVLLCESPAIALAACLLAVDALAAALGRGPAGALADGVAALDAQARAQALPADTLALLREVRRRDLPWWRLGADTRIVQVGHGRHRRRFSGTELEDASATAGKLSRSVHGLPGMLATAGLAFDPQRAGSPHLVRGWVVGGRLVAATRPGEASGDGVGPGPSAAHCRSIERAARALRLGVAAVDLDPGPADDGRENAGIDGAAVTAVQRAPALPPETAASARAAVVAAVVDRLVGDGGDLRVPTVGVTGSQGKTTTCRMLEAILADAGHTVAGTGSQGVRIGGRTVLDGDRSGGGAARSALLDPSVDAGVFEFARGGLLKRGMTLDGVDVGVVLNVRDNHVGVDGLRDSDDLARVKSTVVRFARRAVVLNADDPRCLAMRAVARAPESWLVAPGGRSRELVAHLASGGPVAWREGDGDAVRLVFERPGGAPQRVDPRAIPATLGGLARVKVENALFAIAAAAALGHDPARSVHALQGFDADAQANPGRLNLLRGAELTVLIDTPDGEAPWRELAHTARGLPVRGRRIALVAPYGNRTDAFLQSVGRAAASTFELCVCSSVRPRTRAPADVAAQVAVGLRAGGLADEAILFEADYLHAVERTLAAARPGDLVAIHVDYAGFARVIDRVRARLEAASRAGSASAGGR